MSFGMSDQHRTGTAAHGDFKRLTDGVGQLGDVLNNEIVLGNRHGDAGDVHFLEAVQSEQTGAHVAGDGHHRDRIHVSGGNTGNQIGRAGAGGCDDYADLAGGTGVTICGMGSALFMGGQDVADFSAVFVQRVVQIEHRTARITEHGVYALLQQAFDDNFCTC